MEFSWQEYWSGLPFSSPGDLPDPRIKPLQADSLSLSHLGSPIGGTEINVKRLSTGGRKRKGNRENDGCVKNHSETPNGNVSD